MAQNIIMKFYSNKLALQLSIIITKLLTDKLNFQAATVIQRQLSKHWCFVSVFNIVRPHTIPSH